MYRCITSSAWLAGTGVNFVLKLASAEHKACRLTRCCNLQVLRLSGYPAAAKQHIGRQNLELLPSACQSSASITALKAGARTYS